MSWNLRRDLATSLLIAMMGLSMLLVAGATPAAAQVPSCASAGPGAIAISLVLNLAEGTDLTLVGGPGGSPPFTVTSQVVATCKATGEPVPGATVRIFASDTPGIDVTPLNGAQIGAQIAPNMLFAVCGGAASPLAFCDVVTNASGVASFTITSPTANPAAVGGPVLIGSHREQIRVAFGTTLVDSSGIFIGPNTGGFLFATAPAAVPELDSFVLFGAGGLALAGYALKRRRAPVAQ